ncbi:DUF1566 domain-containing protein [Ferrimonas pelagia]|uniref:Lcl C-terminal domain-containing protein n=1 Tax=Ferrimonas pelagia TaxID=1177826 RepID=A0ABP9EUN3_9GAMM
MKHVATLGALALCLLSPSALAELPYQIVDTNQTSAYGQGLGQDAHFVGASPTYRDNDDGTVSDTVTALMWTQDPGEKITYAEAVKRASSLRTGGYNDWRLPTIKELYSLIQLNGVDPDPKANSSANLRPFIDDSVFAFAYGDVSKGERIIDAQYVSATQYVSTTMNQNDTVFGVNFADGRIKGYPIKNRRGEKTFFALYVRGNPEYGQNQFVDNQDGTITDEATGLTWMKADSGQGMDWPDALAYAGSATFAGHSDWRLPNAKELQSIIDYSRSPDTTDSAAIDPLFESTAIANEAGQKDFAHYWTNTTHVSTRSNRAATYFAFGRSLGWMGRDGQKQLMDVHGAGSQRSDPKTGDPAKLPFGRGPQGDVVRINNLVRLVRGGAVEPVDAPIVEQSARQRRAPPGEGSEARPQRRARSQ